MFTTGAGLPAVHAGWAPTTTRCGPCARWPPSRWGRYTLVDYRNSYAQYKSDPDFIAAHASAAFIVTWDDHEVDNNYAGDIDENDTPPEVFLVRRAAAYQVYYEPMPLRAATIPKGPRDVARSETAVWATWWT